MNTETYDAIVIGSGPAGHNAAVTAANLGARTLIIEREVNVGGSCVQYGTIPSKTLRETAVTLASFSRRSGDVYEISQQENLRTDSLMTRLHQVVSTHQATAEKHLRFAGVETIHGQAEFVSAHEILIRTPNGGCQIVRGDKIFIATGSRPRNPPEIPIDHENILDSDSVLSMTYLPQSMAILGAGVIASEYASIFASFGVRVVMLDKYPAPLGFLDADLVDTFCDHFRASGGTFMGNSKVESMEWDGVSQVVTQLDSGEIIKTDKAMVAQGRIANTDSLHLEKAGLKLTDRGLIQVDCNFQTDVKSIFAVGDTIGPPSLASASLHQGRSAASYAFAGQATPCQSKLPSGIYSIPEIASVGISEQQAKKSEQAIMVGRTDFRDVARGQIMATSGGFLKLLADEAGRQLLGVHIIGEGATELVHIGQLAIAANMTVDELAVTNFNFPTLAETYRLAAIEIINQRNQRTDVSPSLSDALNTPRGPQTPLQTT